MLYTSLPARKVLIFLISFAVLTSCTAIERISESQNNEPAEELTPDAKQKIDHLFYEGQKQKVTGTHSRAAENFRNILQINPNMDVAHYELAIYYRNEGEVDRAEYHIKRASEIDKSNHWYKNMHASILSERSEYTKAGAIYEELAEQFPQQRKYYEQAIEKYSEGNAFRKALKVIDKMESRHGYSSPVGFKKFQIYSLMGEEEKAVKELEKLISQHPGDVRFLELLANTHRHNEDYDAAYRVYRQILEKDPNHATSQIALLNYYNQQEQRDKVLEQTEIIIENETIEVDRKIQIHYQVFLRQGVIPEGESETALRFAREIAGQYPAKSPARALYGDVYYQMDSLPEARNQYMKALENDKDVFAVWQNIFFIDLELGDFEALAEITAEAADFYPNHGEVYYFNGLANRETGNYNQSIESFETALSLVFDDDNFRSEIYVQLADSWYQKKNYEKADEHFEKALEIYPDNAVALNNYSYYLSLRNENLEKALEMSGRSLELNPENAAYMDTYGWIKFQMGEYETAREWIAKALEKEPESEEIADHYGDVLYMLGDKEKARKYWEKAHSLSDNNEKIKRKIETGTLHEPEN